MRIILNPMSRTLAPVVMGLSLIGCQPQTKPTPQDTRIAEISLKDAGLTLADLAPERAAEIEKAAMDLFAYQVGTWKSKWDWLGPDGELLGTLEGTEEFTQLVDGYSQMLTNKVPSMNQVSYAMLSYNPVEHKIAFLNVGANGDYWVMKQDPETGTMLSEPHLNADGTIMLLRFTTLRQDPDEMDVQMESSTDGGDTWVVGFKQYMTRVKS